MSVFLSSKYLKYREALEHGDIDHDVACRGCGYNLRGLKYGRNCPECGQMITVQRGLQDVLTSGSSEQRAQWRLGLSLATGCLVAVIAGRVMYFVGQVAGGGVAATRSYVAVGLLVSSVWAVAAWLVTPPSLDLIWPRLRPLRRFIRVTQVLWVPAYVLLLVKHFGPWGGAFGAPAPAWLDVSNVGLRLIASIGALVLAGHMSMIAKEAELDTASTRLERSIVWIVVFTILLLMMFSIFGGRVPWIMLLFIIPMLVGWIWFLALMALGLYEMYAHVTWTIRHVADAVGRQERIEQTKRTLVEEAEAIIRPVSTERHADLPFDGEQPP